MGTLLLALLFDCDYPDQNLPLVSGSIITLYRYHRRYTQFFRH